jgi:hypothetical protein
MGANVSLLAAGYHQPLGGQLGSGIYSGHSGALNYTFNPDSGTTLILAEIPILPMHEKILVNGQNQGAVLTKLSAHSFLQENLSNYSTVILDLEAKDEETVCHNELCCQLKYSTIEVGNSIGTRKTYRLLAFSGIRKVAQETSEFGWEVCALVRCQDESLSSCTQRETMSTSLEKTSMEVQLPNFDVFELSSSTLQLEGVFQPSLSTLDAQFRVIPYGLVNLRRTGNTVKVTSSSLVNISIQTLAIINRTYFGTKRRQLGFARP